MDPKVQKTIIPYDIEKLKDSIEKHKENITSLETGIKNEQQAILDEEKMIAVLEVRGEELKKQLNGNTK